MEIIISAILAYLLSGISQVLKDLSEEPLDRPGWAMHPSFGMALIVGATWFMRPTLEYSYRGNWGRTLVSGVLGFFLQMSFLTLFVFGCISLASLFFDSIILKVTLTVVLIVIGSFIILPLLKILMIPVVLIISLPLLFLFPQEKIHINWCRTCKHFRRIKEYENNVNGLWQSKFMPSNDKLPCDIFLETENTWKQYFGLEPSERSLFPKDCEFFE